MNPRAVFTAATILGAARSAAGQALDPKVEVLVTRTAAGDGAAVHMVQQREISLRELGSGEYRMVIRIRDPQSGKEVTRSRVIAVRH